MGLAIADRWSSLASNYQGFEDVAYHFHSFSKNKRRRKFTFLQKGETNNIATDWFSRASDADLSHPYILNKQAKPHGIRQFKNELFIPIRNINGQIISLQTIDKFGNKRFLTGGVVIGGFYIIDGASKHPYYFCEGFATGSAIAQATDAPVVVTFTASNLCTVAKLFRKRLPRKNFIIAADDDYRPDVSLNVGRHAALKAARTSQARVIVPKSLDGKRRKQDFNDVLVRDGLSWLKQSIVEQVK